MDNDNPGVIVPPPITLNVVYRTTDSGSSEVGVPYDLWSAGVLTRISIFTPETRARLLAWKLQHRKSGIILVSGTFVPSSGQSNIIEIANGPILAPAEYHLIISEVK